MFVGNTSLAIDSDRDFPEILKLCEIILPFVLKVKIGDIGQCIYMMILWKEI